jgi:hypothetical protein
MGMASQTCDGTYDEKQWDRTLDNKVTNNK